jgi:hypothetical protein
MVECGLDMFWFDSEMLYANVAFLAGQMFSLGPAELNLFIRRFDAE